MNEEPQAKMMSLDEIKNVAATVARQMKIAGSGPLPAALRKQFIDVRTALFQLGIYDPVLVRFDSATAPKASTGEVADQLAKVVSSL